MEFASNENTTRENIIENTPSDNYKYYYIRVIVPPRPNIHHSSGTYRCHYRLNVLSSVYVNFSDANCIAVVIAFDIKPDNVAENGTILFKIKDIIQVESLKPVITSELFSLLQSISSYHSCNLSEIFFNLISNSILVSRDKKSNINNKQDLQNPSYDLSDEQNECVSSIINGGKKYYYLYGITGSGKTEVYINCAIYYLQKGKSVIFLLPEILLSNQMIDRLKKRIPYPIYTIHSQLNDKRNEWDKITNTDVCMVVGPQSSAFAPINNLGLVIIDEEHESYKYQDYPFISAKKSVMIRANLNHAKVIMGSATPSLEAYQCMKDKTFVTLKLTKRLTGGTLPSVIIVDLAKESGIISSKLKQKIEQTHQNNKQTLLFLNRKGYYPITKCSHCNSVLLCPDCQVALVSYKSGDLKCHHCEYIEKIPKACPKCQSELAHIGIGIEQVLDNLQELFPAYRISKIDSTNKSQHSKLLDDFQKGKIDILIGTQIIAKGIDFENVSLVGVVSIDGMLNGRDYRAFERMFAMLIQVLGRAGRFSTDGEVVIQTFSPDNKVVQFVKNHDISNFYKFEIENRKQLQLPPYSTLVKILIKSPNEQAIIDYGTEMISYFSKFEDMQLSPPEPDYIKMKDNIYNYLMRCKFLDKKILIKRIEELRHYITLYRESKEMLNGYVPTFLISIDINPDSVF